MAEPTEIVFEVGEQYENEKGVFTVISIDKDEMVIRWAKGEDLRTNIELQRRIQERRQMEKADREAKAKAAKQSSSKSTKAKKTTFSGLQPSDFKNTAARTKWRGRDHLGGAVTQKLPPTSLKINSWAFAQKPEVHWMDSAQRSRGDVDDQPRFFARLDDQALTFGFRIVRPNDQDDSPSAWNAFSEWLAQQENELALHTLATEAGLKAYLRTLSTTIQMQPIEGGWRIDGGDKQQTEALLAAYLGAKHTNGYLELEFARTIEKAEAASRGQEIADDIAALFGQLMPIYQAAVS